MCNLLISHCNKVLPLHIVLASCVVLYLTLQGVSLPWPKMLECSIKVILVCKFDGAGSPKLGEMAGHVDGFL